MQLLKAPSAAGFCCGRRRWRVVYCDNNATTALDPRVFAAMRPYLAGGERAVFGNPSALHDFGAAAVAGARDALRHVYALLGAAPADSVVVTGGASEANNAVLRGFAERNSSSSSKRRPLFVTSAVEHPSVARTVAHIAASGAADVVALPPRSDGGAVAAADVAAALRTNGGGGRAALVSVMFANNETGAVNDVRAIAAAAHDAGALFHTDATQAVGKLPADAVSAALQSADYASISGHKIHGPKGVGALLVRQGRALRSFAPLIHGGEQMSGLRAGTVNVPGLVGLGAAAALLRAGDARATLARIERMRNALEAGIVAGVSGARVLGGCGLRTANTLMVAIPGVEGEALIFDLNSLGVAASTGSACASESLQASPALTQLGGGLAHTGVRFSLSRFTTPSDVRYVVASVIHAVSRLRSFTTSTSASTTNVEE